MSYVNPSCHPFGTAVFPGYETFLVGQSTSKKSVLDESLIRYIIRPLPSAIVGWIERQSDKDIEDSYRSDGVLSDYVMTSGASRATVLREFVQDVSAAFGQAIDDQIRIDWTEAYENGWFTGLVYVYPLEPECHTVLIRGEDGIPFPTWRDGIETFVKAIEPQYVLDFLPDGDQDLRSRVRD